MRSHLKYALAAAAITALAATLALGRSGSTTATTLSGSTEIETSSFDEIWRSASVPLALTVRQIAMSPPPVETTAPPPATVVPPVIRPEAEEETEVAEAEAATKRRRYVTRQKIRKSGRDICARHNMRKVKVGRYRWRCRR